MDALALLCTLHADGPETLRRLRRAGCERLEELETLALGDLAVLLGRGTSAANRFLAEARLLARRVGVELLDPEEVEHELPADGGYFEPDEPGADELDAEVPSLVGQDEEYEEDEEEEDEWELEDAAGELEEEDEEEDEEEEPAEEEIVRAQLVRVREAWRERDASDPPAPTPSPADVLVPLARARTGERLVEAAARVRGLAARDCERLEAAGVRTREQLLEGDALEISRRAGLSYTGVLRLQFVVRRSRSAFPEAAAAPSAPVRPNPAAHPPRPSDLASGPARERRAGGPGPLGDGPGAGGPFA